MNADDDRGAWRDVPPTADELTTVTVSVRRGVLEGVEADRRGGRGRSRGRLVGGSLGVLALVGLGVASGGVALGLIPSPFDEPEAQAPPATVSVAPTSTPAPSPSPTSTPTDDPAAEFAAPVPSLPLDCAAVADQASLGSLLRAPDQFNDFPDVFMPDVASLRQAGVLTCMWGSSTDSASASLIMDVSSDVEAGRTWIDERRAAGAAASDLGDESVLSCSDVDARCEGSLVAGAFWFEFRWQQSPTLAPDASALLTGFFSRVVDVVAPLTPTTPWVAPDAAGRWDSSGGCAALATARPMSDVLGSPGVSDTAIDLLPGSRNGIERTQSDAYECRWSTVDGVQAPDGAVSGIDVEIAPGARWAYESAPDTFGDGDDPSGGATPVVVDGAQDATLRCSSAEGLSCWLDVLVDDSWMQVGYPNAIPPEQAPLLTAVAETIIAARP